MPTVEQINKVLTVQVVKPAIVICPYCGKNAKLVDAKQLYPHRKDLYGRKFWECKPCDARVGTHAGTDKYTPLGTLANKQLRYLRTSLHKKFDSLWKEHIYTRTSAYKWLSKKMGISMVKCHIGSFDKVTCDRAMFFTLNELAALKRRGQ